MTAVAQTSQTRTGRMKVHTVRGGGGLRLHVREWGRPDGPPILFIHGWSQNHLCWVKQYESALADEFRLVAYDLRGHGMSEAPLEPEHYTDGKALGRRPGRDHRRAAARPAVLVGWSYGAFVICDYIRAYGQDRIAAIELRRRRGQARRGGLRHADRPRLPRPLRRRHRRRPADQHLRHALVRAGLRRQAGVGRRPRDGDVLERRRAGARSAPTSRARELDCDDVLRALEVPLLVTQGRADTVVLPAMAEHVLATCPTAEASWYDGVGHVPHLEEPERFNRELAELTRRVRA